MSEVIIEITGHLARITLNRPKAINALTSDMVKAVTEALESVRNDDAITAVSIEGDGERGLCAGGDVRAVREAYLAGDNTGAFEFFDAEYRMNAIIASYPKLIVAYQDGIVMGGGVGISTYAGLRIATERTQMAMPEVIIGFFPDVGVTYRLARAGGIGAYLAASGATFTGSDACLVGLSDVVTTCPWTDVVSALAGGATRDDILTLVNKAAITDEAPLSQQRAWIDDAFGASAPFRPARDALKRLETSTNPQAREAGAVIASRSPLSVAATIEALNRAAQLPDLEAALRQDAVLARALVTSGDFVEGVRAQLVDKDRHPNWSAAGLHEISQEQINTLFS